MHSAFSSSSPAQLKAVADLLQTSFNVEGDTPLLNASYLNWKLHQEGPAWVGSRSYVLTNNEELIAHATVWPIQLRLATGVRDGLGFGDWAAAASHPGAGLLLLKKLVTLASFVLVTGGAEITRQILPRMGFQHWADRTRWVRVLRPMRQVLTRGETLGWKEPARLTRNLGWSLARTASRLGWTAESTFPDASSVNLVDGQLGSVHSVEFLRYMLACPTVQFKFLRLRYKQEDMGYAMVSLVAGQARIADLRIASDEQDQYNAAVSTVVQWILKETLSCEVVMFGSTAPLDLALSNNGFRPRGDMPLVVFDPDKQIANENVPQLGMLEDDSSLILNPVSPYLT